MCAIARGIADTRDCFGLLVPLCRRYLRVPQADHYPRTVRSDLDFSLRSRTLGVSSLLSAELMHCVCHLCLSHQTSFLFWKALLGGGVNWGLFEESGPQLE